MTNLLNVDSDGPWRPWLWTNCDRPDRRTGRGVGVEVAADRPRRRRRRGPRRGGRCGRRVDGRSEPVSPPQVISLFDDGLDVAPHPLPLGTRQIAD